MDLGTELAERVPPLAPGVFDLFEKPFSVRVSDVSRLTALLNVGRVLDCGYGARALDQVGPHFSWNEKFLRYRADCYATAHSPLAGQARGDLEDFLAGR